MRKLYVIYDSIRDKYVSQIIKICQEKPFLDIKFGDVYSAIAFDEYRFAQIIVDEICNWYSENFPEKKMNLSIRRIHV
jgi:hypothetical protein